MAIKRTASIFCDVFSQNSRRPRSRLFFLQLAAIVRPFSFASPDFPGFAKYYIVYHLQVRLTIYPILCIISILWYTKMFSFFLYNIVWQYIFMIIPFFARLAWKGGAQSYVEAFQRQLIKNYKRVLRQIVGNETHLDIKKQEAAFMKTK